LCPGCIGARFAAPDKRARISGFVIFAVTSIDSGVAGMAMGVAGIFQFHCDDSAGARAGLDLASRDHVASPSLVLHLSFRKARRARRRAFLLRTQIAALNTTNGYPHTEAKS